LSAHDEDAAFEVVRELQDLAKDAVSNHGGRVVKHIGDAVLSVFDSTNSAVQAALDLQTSFRNSKSAQAHEVALRIGVHAGEIREDTDGDVYGDGVNIASRVEGAAEPWQVVVTEAVWQQIRTRSSYSTAGMGERAFKGIEDPLPLYVVSSASPLDLVRSESEPQPDAVLLDRYEVRQLIGMGGMGQVFLAHDRSLDVPVALKVIRDELRHEPTSLKHLKQEARLCRSLSHPNILRIHDFQEGGGREFLVMEYVEGQTLQERLAKEDTLEAQEVRRIGIEACKALEYAHREGVIHRDLKPGNILLSTDGSVKVADFGLARVARDSMMRLSGVMASGTLIYMSPEQLDGETGERSDLYSLGVVLYEMLSGNPPFVTGDIPTQIRQKPPKPLGGEDEELAAVILRMLAKDPEDRFASVAELRVELAGSAVGDERTEEERQRAKAAEPPPESPAAPPPASRPRRPRLLLLAIAAVLAVSIPTVVMREQRQPAQAQADSLEAATMAQAQADSLEAATMAQAQADSLEAARLAQAQADSLEAARLAQDQADSREAARLAQVRADSLARRRAEFPTGPLATASDEYEELVLGYLQTLSENIQDQGFGPAFQSYLGSLSESSRENISLTLPQDADIAIWGVCDNECSNLDLTLTSGTGEIVDNDKEPDDVPLVVVQTGSSQSYTLRVSMATCTIEPCYYAVGVYRRN
jgi:predicted Ser/Thr protein kinase